ncbi:MAG: PadR family transcriptional regulator, partial [Methanoregula sp.]
RARRPGKPLQPVENPGPTLGASPSTCLSTLAPAAALSLPSLAGVPPSYEYYDGDARLFAFLRRLAELGIAGTPPSEIEKLRTSPLAYAEASLASWVNAQGGDIIDGNINYSLAIQAENEGMLANTAIKDSLLITVEAEQCGYMVAGAALDVLEAKAKGQATIDDVVKKSLEPVVLSLLEKPISGYDIVHEIHNRYNVLIPQARIYTYLYDLEQKGYLLMKTSGKSKLYSPTDSGKKYIHNRLNEFKFVFRHIMGESAPAITPPEKK